MKLRVLVCGDRYWDDESAIRQALFSIQKHVEIVIQGKARGADTIAAMVAEDLGLPVKDFYADWVAFGRAAGPLRNREQLAFLKEAPVGQRLVLAFHNDLKNSKGTRDMVKISEKAGIPVWLYPKHTFKDLSGLVHKLLKESV